ncbi:MAG: DNA alkylation repair protein [Bdellovibrio sp.]
MPQKKQAATESAFKNWINADLVRRFGLHILKHYSDFDVAGFEKLLPQLKSLELKARIGLICDFLHAHLPTDYRKALRILLKAVSRPQAGIQPLTGFDLWPVTEFVQRYGLDKKDFDESLQALHELTQKFTAEFAIRPFLIEDEKYTLKVLHRWTQDSEVSVRRLVSEGTRPRLPWGQQLKSFIKDPAPTLPLLEDLKYDEELFVRKSVANHLNDISKDHPSLTLKIIQRWLQEAPTEHQAKIRWIARHSLRTLLKKGHPQALKIFGYKTNHRARIGKLKISQKQIVIGENLDFSFEISSSSPTQVMIDYLVHYKKANGSNAAKVFKLTTKKLKAGEILLVQKKHSFKLVTTRTYYPGIHYLEIMIKGQLAGKVRFELKEK